MQVKTKEWITGNYTVSFILEISFISNFMQWFYLLLILSIVACSSEVVLHWGSQCTIPLR